MSLGTGTRLGQYEILAPIGAGGMGEVYKARDTKLKRDVAIKVLPDPFASDPERMARFQREAEVLASLNHPNIAHIYGVEERALVMELVEGEPLSGPLPIDLALGYAQQIAGALEYAHEKGVIHRDLKPANVKVTTEGVVKLLDFGLAKAIEDPARQGEDASNSPTLTLGATRAGMIMGTAAYMSPEQARGKPADRRADIWSFGAVLYEMLAGRRAFEGESVSDTLAGVLKLDPDWNALPAATPPAIRNLIRRCLTKDRRHRLQAIGEARIVLETPLSDEPAAVAPAPRHRRLPWIVAAVTAVVALALILRNFFYFRKAAPVQHVLRYTIAAPENATTLHSFAISPDGKLVAMAAEVKGKRQLWLRALDSLQIRPVQGTDDAVFPFWSPDSRYIGFFGQGKLKKIAAGGGPVQSLCEAPSGRGGSWNRDNVIVFSTSMSTGVVIRRVSATGGVPSDFTKSKGRSEFPVFLRDGRHFLYLFGGVPADQNGIYLSSLDGTENQRIMPDLSSVVIAAGRMLFVRESTLMVQPFESVSGQAAGEGLPVAEGIST